MPDYAIDAQGLVKKFSRKAEPQPGEKKRLFSFLQRRETTWFTAVDGVDLQIQRGEIFGLLGPNGAGKTTTIRMLCTMLEPSGGTARVNGYDVVRQSALVRQNLGTVLAGDRSIYWKLSGKENLEYFAALYHIPPALAKQRVAELLERMELKERANDLVEKYSTGMKQRIAISKALLARPPILLLDEPTLGLDPQAARKVRELVTELKNEGHTILLTTHYMEEADLLSDRIGIIDKGKIIALDTPAALKATIKQSDVIKMEVAGWKPELAERITSLSEVDSLVTRWRESDAIWEISFQSAHSRAILPQLLERINTNGTRLVNLNVVQPSLEDVFIHMTGKGLRE